MPANPNQCPEFIKVSRPKAMVLECALAMAQVLNRDVAGERSAEPEKWTLSRRRWHLDSAELRGQ